MQAGPGARRLTLAAYGLASAMLAAQFAIPWFNETLHLGPASQGALERLASTSSDHSEPLWQLWRLAWRIFADAPIAGSGFGEFAGAAFSLGPPPDLAQFGGVVWTSPHNLLLQLLAETGAPGAFLALGGLCIWWWQAGRCDHSCAAAGAVVDHRRSGYRADSFEASEYPWWSADSSA